MNKLFKGALKATVLSACIAIGFLSSCKEDDNAELVTNLRLVNTSEHAGNLNLFVNNNKVNSAALTYGQASDFIQLKAGRPVVDVRTEGSNDVLARINQAFEYGKNYTLYVLSSDTTINFVSSDDYTTAPAVGKAKFRFLNLSTAVRAVAAKLDDTVTVTDSLLSGTGSNYQIVNAGTHSLKFNSKSGATVSSENSISLEAGKVYSFYFSGTNNNGLKFVVH